MSTAAYDVKEGPWLLRLVEYNGVRLGLADINAMEREYDHACKLDIPEDETMYAVAWMFDEPEACPYCWQEGIVFGELESYHGTREAAEIAFNFCEARLRGWR